jgi:hypothetical protein
MSEQKRRRTEEDNGIERRRWKMRKQKKSGKG